MLNDHELCDKTKTCLESIGDHILELKLQPTLHVRGPINNIGYIINSLYII